MKCLLVIDYFFPSALGGGPMHSVGNFISAQRDPEGIEVLTRDRDLSGERYSEADMLDQKGLCSKSLINLHGKKAAKDAAKMCSNAGTMAEPKRSSKINSQKK